MNMYRAYQLLKNVYHWGQSHWWRIWYGRPDRHLKLYGVTGTNGKTTTCYLLDSILVTRYGRNDVGMLTTVAFRVGSREEFNETKMTTMKSRSVWKYLREMKNSGVRHVVLEVTSHALDQKRLAGMRFVGVIWLNLEREHLDYHRTMEAYAAAKGKIVKYLRPGSVLVANRDSKWVSKTIEKKILKGARVVWFTGKEALGLEVALPGVVNKENGLAAATLARAMGIKEKFVRQGLLAMKHVPGRMEWVEGGQNFKIVIDYAVTPDALLRLYKDMRTRADRTRGRVLGLLGAAGLRDRGKRPEMARTVAQFADILVIAREDPWTETEEQIFSDLEKGLEGSKIQWRRIVDRRKALQWLLNQARRGDVVVVTGKGAERGMGIGKKIIPWSDKQVIEDILTEKR